MKKIAIISGLLLLAVSVFAKENEVKELKLKNGIPVYYMENTNSKIDAVTINVEGGTYTFSPEYSGLEEIVFEMMGTGSKDYSYEYLQSYFYQTGSSISQSAQRQYSNLTLVTIDEYFDSGLPLLTDGFLNPVFNKREYDKLMTIRQQSVQELMNNPQSLGEYSAQKIIFENHPYATATFAVPESIENLTVENIKKHHKTLLDSRRIKIFAVVHKDSRELVDALNETIGNIPALKTPLVNIHSESVTVNHAPVVLVHEAASGTGFVYRTYSLPAYGTEEYYAYLLASEVYKTIMFNVLRNKYSMCYSPFEACTGGEVNIGFEYLYRVSKIDDVKAQVAEARSLMSEGKVIVSTNADGSFIVKDVAEVLEGTKSSVISALYSSQKTTAGLAGRMIKSVYCYGDPTALDSVASLIRGFTSQQVIDVFNKYIVTENDMWCAVVGPENEVAMEEILNK